MMQVVIVVLNDSNGGLSEEFQITNGFVSTSSSPCRELGWMQQQEQVVLSGSNGEFPAGVAQQRLVEMLGSVTPIGQTTTKQRAVASSSHPEYTVYHLGQANSGCRSMTKGTPD
ncbi:expressed unknown protein [Seminavis robusta]|uniref:Uncharacterized protein n=1 Tax=Seminavis robusta TaxID=568900 RepID=A0A9N8DP68_9STRA|nr:expressed unknown protein [Seminavis robusta]|eukprot:Sro248_g098480.1 n/a (114) ;mRNA; r:77820-78161